ncbi:MAG TPA: FAD-dependent oxidoreductase [Acidobacteriota bacterium]|nr:FAD-dependent oxidoreductase [Acidobacteriota bacterium]HQF87941.1 FAD-dependent oxidoreductase [Acidobacteriota bacterium]HQK86482.1 FAD-dependent oxidoreductase [Acidobacteriota bacterium]
MVSPTAAPPVEPPKAGPSRLRRRAAAVDEAREAEALRRPVRRRTRRSDHPDDFEFVRLNVPCQWACPVLTDVPDYIFAIAGGDRDKSYLINRATNLIPGVLGHVCSRPCEAACRHGEPDLGEPVAICHLKRVAADFRNQDHQWPDRLFPDSGCTVGVVGGGPAGLAAAQLLAALGHGVTVYEAMPRLGGMLMYGIPVFRLPRELVEAEIGRLLDSGIIVKTGVHVGHDITVPELLARHQAVVLATGTSLARGLAIPGGDLPGVHSGLDFMMNVNDGRPPAVGRRVVTIGGGFTAHDCARSVLRLGAAESYLCVRTTEEDLWVTREEILETKREGVRYLNLVSSMQIAGSDRVEGVVFARNRLGPVGKYGQRMPVAIEGSEFVFAADMVIAATGQYADTTLAAAAFGAAPRFDPRHGTCEVPGLFAAGDFCTGAATVIEAMGHARRVAQAVDEYLTGARRLRRVVRVRPSADTPRPRAWDFIPRADMPMLAVPQRLAAFGAVVKTGFPAPVGERESHRCYLCHMKYEIRLADCIACGLCAAVCPRDCIGPAAAAGPGMPPVWTERWDEAAAVVIDSVRCIRCGLCLRVCPTRCIEVERVEIADVAAGE